MFGFVIIWVASVIVKSLGERDRTIKELIREKENLNE